MNETDIGAAAALATDAQFSTQIAGFTKLTPTDIDSLFPTQNDQQQLSKLIDVITKATNDNDREQQLINGIANVSGAVIKLLKTTAIPIP